MTEKMSNDEPQTPPPPVFENTSFMAAPFPTTHARFEQDPVEEAVPLWLITFTDTIGLMLTFFVMMYAMSSTPVEKFEEVSAALSGEFTRQYAKPYSAGPEDVINIDRIDNTKALDLTYLKTIVTQVLAAQDLKTVQVTQQDDRLVITLPSDLLFAPGEAVIAPGAVKPLRELAMALSNIPNRIEITGHTDPRPQEGQAQSPYKSLWALSLARAGAVGVALRAAGYSRPLSVRGEGAARFETLPTSIPLEERYERARRVDILVMKDTGKRSDFMGVE